MDLVRFSGRTAWDRRASEFDGRVTAARRRWGTELLDLTVSNPTVCGLSPVGDGVLEPLRSAEGLRYEASAMGLRSARESVARYYARHGAAVDAERIVLTASTSEAYSFAFHVLGDAEDEVLVAQPSYPLFDFLADLADVRVRPYPLFYDHGWWIDFAEMERAITARTRVVVVVHPNNPTGHATSAAERERLYAMCERHGLALIVDEVFLDYPHRAEERVRSFAVGAEPPVLTLVMSGLSKVVALPQMKVGWVVVRGPEAERSEALGRLELVADTFLSVGSPAQLALPVWLGLAGGVQERILERVRGNLRLMDEAGLVRMQADAGWSAVVRVPRVFREESAAEALLERGVLVHPASFYGMEDRGRVVMSLIAEPEVMRTGCRRIAEVAAMR